MPIKIIFTLVVAFLLVLFGIFNSSPFEFSLFGIRDVSTPLAFFVFIVFLAGGIYAGFLAFFDQVRQSLRIRKLKRKIKNLQEALEEQEQIGLQEKSYEEIKEPESPLEDDVENRVPNEIDDDSELTSAEREIALQKIKEQEKKMKVDTPNTRRAGLHGHARGNSTREMQNAKRKHKKIDEK